ncbi:cysteine--tRNA ligase [Candidatus Saccharibacteria bacterium]|nr:MAG: cysteine--tRNA ligase [Candidatus Saccharibacteria bacterium]
MKLYNTLTRQVDELRPLQNGTVKLYTCGLTVYSQPHIGNWLGYIYWDVLVRALRTEGFTVERTQNITDVGHLTSDDDNGEDKMEKGARHEGSTAWDVAAKYIEVAERESNLLGLLIPEHLVRATDMIAQQIDFAKTLDAKGFLYEIPGDGMYFDTSKLTDYGKLARLDISGLEAGSRVSVEGSATLPTLPSGNFHLQCKRDMEWESPWGVGFPGWHLECSVIARETLGDCIDIHTGGIDHIPVHHTNEIAQTEAVTGKQFSQFWVHNNHLKADGQKMSKSLGNIYTLQDIASKGYDMDAFRVFALRKHYRTEGNFTWDNLEAAANRLRNWQQTFDMRWQQMGDQATQNTDPEKLLDSFTNALLNDLDTVTALRTIDSVVHTIEQQGMTSNNLWLVTKLMQLVRDTFGISLFRDDIADDQKVLVKQREQKRADKDWAGSDELRAQLMSQGIGLKDTQNGAVWYWL